MELVVRVFRTRLGDNLVDDGLAATRFRRLRIIKLACGLLYFPSVRSLDIKCIWRQIVASFVINFLTVHLFNIGACQLTIGIARNLLNSVICKC